MLHNFQLANITCTCGREFASGQQQHCSKCAITPDSRTGTSDIYIPRSGLSAAASAGIEFPRLVCSYVTLEPRQGRWYLSKIGYWMGCFPSAWIIPIDQALALSAAPFPPITTTARQAAPGRNRISIVNAASTFKVQSAIAKTAPAMHDKLRCEPIAMFSRA